MRGWATLVLVTVIGCAYNPLFPDVRTVADRAREIAPRCSHAADSTGALVLSPALIEGVEPAYSYVQSGNDRAIHLRGARFRVRPELDVSAETLERRLECHQAGVIMGSAPPLADDPFALTGTWLDIKTDSTGDGFLIAIEVDDLGKAQEVLARARHFADEARP
jgi:hypothetical protein